SAHVVSGISHDIEEDVPFKRQCTLRPVCGPDEQTSLDGIGVFECQGPFSSYLPTAHLFHSSSPSPHRLKESGKITQTLLYFEIERIIFDETGFGKRSLADMQERISKKRTKNKAKTTKPDTEWKSVVKTKSRQSPSVKKSTKVNPDKSKVKLKAIK
ncbi:hypothetical protein Tco_0993053, partial [Tanacetum coccineum]